MTEPTTRVSRRSFLFAVGASGAVVAAAMVAQNTTPKAQAASANGDRRATRGYHASQHVNAYYRTVKI
jgi:hypothetical protein